MKNIKKFISTTILSVTIISSVSCMNTGEPMFLETETDTKPEMDPQFYLDLLGYIDRGDADKVEQLLLSSNACVNKLCKLHNQYLSTHFSSITPLLLASEKGDAKIVEILLRFDANPNMANIQMKTPLWCASLNRHVKIVAILLSAGANPNIVDQAGQTALYCAAISRHKEIVDLLLRAGANPNIANQYGCTPLLNVADSSEPSSEPSIVEALIKAGADVNRANRIGITPLILASKAQFTQSEEIVEMLLKAGAEPNKADNNGNTPLTVASKGTFKEEVVAKLKQFGAKDTRSKCSIQ